MSKFLEVANTFKEALETDNQDLTVLRDAASSLRKGFADYLGVPSGNPININGNEGPHVAIGGVDESGFFRGVPKKQFPRSSDTRIRFVILFTYDQEPKPRTQGCILFHMDMEQTSAGFKVWLDDFDEFDVTLENMTSLFDAMHAKAIEKARSAKN